MNPLDTITLEAFLTALAQLDSVPSEVRIQLNQFGSVSFSCIGRLHSTAEAYPPLFKLYQEARLAIGGDTERNKLPVPEIDPHAENYNQELINLADEIFKDPNPVETCRKKSNQPGVLFSLLSLIKQSRL